MGPTGCGKSTFIAAASGKGHDAINHGQASTASGVRTIRATHPKDGRPVVFVDTPGFDDTYVADTETLQKIADWLVKTHKTRAKIRTVIYLHRITDNRMSVTQLKNLQMFAKLCGPQAMPNAVIATTMWDDIWESTGVDREQELRGQFWNSMLADGCRLERFQNTYESAWDIIGEHSSLHLPDEMAGTGKLLHETEAYSINTGLPKWIVDLKMAFRTALLGLGRRSHDQQDRIIAVMGPTGAGKSTLIDVATRQDGHTVGHGIKSHTSDIRSVRVLHPTLGHPVVFVDTPGFDDTYKPDTEILTIIANWLMKTQKGKANLATIIYLHRITDNRMTGSLLKNLRMFISLWGQEATPNIVIATTMWSEVKTEHGERREKELKDTFWKDLLDEGCRVERFEDTYESAWLVIDRLATEDWAKMRLPQEMVDRHLTLQQTEAGVTLSDELKRLVKARKDSPRRLRAQAKK